MMRLLSFFLSLFSGGDRVTASAVKQDLRGQLLTELALRHAQRQSYLLELAQRHEAAGNLAIASNLREAADNLLHADALVPPLDPSAEELPPALELPPLPEVIALSQPAPAERALPAAAPEAPRPPEPPVKRGRGRPRKTNHQP